MRKSRGAHRDAPRRGWTALLRANLGVVLVVVGALVLLYPVVGTVWNDHRQAVRAQRIVARVHDVPHEKRRQMLRAAHEYNLHPARGPILDPWLEHFVPNSAAWHDYLTQLAGPDGVMATLSIPSIHLDLPVYHGTSDAVLERGIGHLFGTSLPVGGRDTHAVLTGHSGLGTATMFDHLPDLKNGDAFYIDVAGERLKYVVRSREVVLPTQIDSLRVRPGQDMVTLVTCTPYGINSHRLLVHGYRAPLDAADRRAGAAASTWAWRPWMWIPIVIILGAFAILAWVRRRNRRERAASDAARNAPAPAPRPGSTVP